MWIQNHNFLDESGKGCGNMEDNKYSANNENKLSNTKIELRKAVLNDIRELCDKVKSERYSEQALTVIIQELKEIAEMIRDKDSMMQIREKLESRKSTIKLSELIIEIRHRISEIIKTKRDVTVNQYDEEELEVVRQEVEEMIELIQDKDLIMSMSKGKIQGGIDFNNMSPSRKQEFEKRFNLGSIEEK